MKKEDLETSMVRILEYHTIDLMRKNYESPYVAKAFQDLQEQYKQQQHGIRTHNPTTNPYVGHHALISDVYVSYILKNLGDKK